MTLGHVHTEVVLGGERQPALVALEWSRLPAVCQYVAEDPEVSVRECKFAREEAHPGISGNTIKVAVKKGFSAQWIVLRWYCNSCNYSSLYAAGHPVQDAGHSVCRVSTTLPQHAYQYDSPFHVRSNSDWHTESIQSAVLPPSWWSARRRSRRSSHTHTVSPTRPHTTLRLRHSQSGAQGPKNKARRPEAAAPNMMHAPGGAPIPLVLCHTKHARRFFQFVRASRLQRSRARPPSGVSHWGSTDGSPVDVHVHDVL